MCGPHAGIHEAICFSAVLADLRWGAGRGRSLSVGLDHSSCSRFRSWLVGGSRYSLRAKVLVSNLSLRSIGKMESSW